MCRACVQVVSVIYSYAACNVMVTLISTAADLPFLDPTLGEQLASVYNFLLSHIIIAIKYIQTATMSLIFRNTVRSSLRLQAFAARNYHATPISRLPYKDTQDKDSLSPRSSEHVQSTTDDGAAGLDKAAYKPGEAGPEEALRESSDSANQRDNPLDFSGANQELSTPRGDEKSNRDIGPGTEQSNPGRSSGKSGSSPKKGSKLQEHMHKTGANVGDL